MARKVTITITKGVPVIQVQGVKGASCQKMTEDLEQALGTVKAEVKTSEFYEKADQDRNRQR